MSTEIAQKIAKLLAKADSSTHPEEAEVFMAKAHQMLEAHGLNLLDLGKLGDDPVGKTDKVMTSSDGWKDKIAFQLAWYYGCELVTIHAVKTRSSREYVIFGRESARITFQPMAPFIFRQVAAMALKEYKHGRYPSAAKARTALAAALAVRLCQLSEDNRQKADVGNSGLNQLVPVDLIKQARERAFPNARLSGMKFDYDFNAQEVAKKISLNRQTAAPAGTLRIGQ